jgi:hypothetical protein
MSVDICIFTAGLGVLQRCNLKTYFGDSRICTSVHCTSRGFPFIPLTPSGCALGVWRCGL